MRTAIISRYIDAEVLGQLDRIRVLSFEQQRTEAYQLTPQHGRAGVIAALEIGTTGRNGTWDCWMCACDGLIEHPAISTLLLIEILDEHPLSRVTRAAAYVLGEIAYKQGLDRDPRIVDAALRFLARTHAAGMEELYPALGLARELSRATPLPEASPYARMYLDAIERNETDLFGGYEAMGILYQNEKLAFIDELAERVYGIDEDHPLHADLDTFMAEITGPGHMRNAR